MKPYIVRPDGKPADVFDRTTGTHIGIVFRTYHGDWEVQIDGEPYWWVQHPDCATALEALWRHYLDEHKEQ